MEPVTSAIIATLGIGSIVAAFIGWRTTISGHRQEWINALRKDIALYLKELQHLNYAIGDLLKNSLDEKLVERKRKARIAVLHVYWRIVLRLNRNEKLHIDLKKKLEGLQTLRDEITDSNQIDEAVDLVRRVLKLEWEVTKYGVFAPMVRRFKVWWSVTSIR